MSYEDKLNNVSKTTKTTKDVLDVANTKAWLNFYLTLLIIICFTILLLFLTKKIMKKEVGSFWDFLVKPFRDLSARNKVSKKISENAPGEKPSLTQEEAKQVAEDIAGCIGPIKDDEDRIFNLLQSKIQNAADWELVKGFFGQRRCLALLSGKHYGDIEHVLGHNFTNRECKKVREILNSKGIKTTI